MAFLIFNLSNISQTFPISVHCPIMLNWIVSNADGLIATTQLELHTLC